MHALRSYLGILLASGLCVISIACNYSFGTHLAPGIEGIIYGLLGSFADGLKTMMPLVIATAWASNQKFRTLAGVLLFLIFSAYSLTSALGLYSLNRSNSVGMAYADKASYELARKERDRIEARMQSLGQVRPAGAIRADLDAAKQHYRWTSTNGCTNATVAPSRDFCNKFARLQGELATAKEADSLRARLSDWTSKIDGMNLSKVMRSADPQSEALSRLTGFTTDQIRTGLAGLVALLVELGSGLGLWVVIGSIRPEVKLRNETSKAPEAFTRDDHIKNPANIVQTFVESKLVKQPDAEILSRDLYSGFLIWCQHTGQQLISQTAFGRELTDLGFERSRRGGKIRYLGVNIDQVD